MKNLTTSDLNDEDFKLLGSILRNYKKDSKADPILKKYGVQYIKYGWNGLLLVKLEKIGLITRSGSGVFPTAKGRRIYKDHFDLIPST